MRPASLLLALLLALAGCGDAGASDVARNSDPSPTGSPSEVPGTRPSTATPTPTQTPSPVQESLTPTSSPTPPEPVSTEVVRADPETLAGYQALATGLSAFFVKAQGMEKEHPGAHPHSVQDIDELLGDVYPEGVDLAVFEDDSDALTMCLTGPSSTSAVLGDHGEGVRAIFGTGGCDRATSIRDLEDGDLVVDITFDIVGQHEPRAHYSGRVMKGQNLADQIPDLLRFVRVMNRAAAG